MKRLFPDTDQQMAQAGTPCRKRPSDVNPTHNLCLGWGQGGGGAQTEEMLRGPEVKVGACWGS